MSEVRVLALRERLRFAALVEGLSTAQWQSPSLCADWSVRDVAAHTVAYVGQSLPGLAANMIRARGNVDVLNACLYPRFAAMPPSELIEAMRRDAEPRGAAGLFGGRVALIECVVHQQDIRRPLGLDRTVPEDALRVSLSYARISPVIGGARRTRGLRLVASDMEWSAGHGPEVHGPGEALLLAMTGRVDAVRGELTGAGLARLR